MDVWLPEDAPLSATRDRAQEAETVIRRVAGEFGQHHTGDDGQPRQVLQSLTTFVGGGGPRFWFSVAPELSQLNYAQIIVQVKDKHDTQLLVPLLQKALAGEVPGARIDVRELENGQAGRHPGGRPPLGRQPRGLRRLAEEVKAIFRGVPTADRVRDDWGEDSFSVKLQVDSDRANLAGVSNLDVALSSATGDERHPADDAARGRPADSGRARGCGSEERARVTDVQNLYVYSSGLGHSRCRCARCPTSSTRCRPRRSAGATSSARSTVSAFPVPGALPSEVMNAARPQTRRASRATLPPGYQLVIGGEDEEQNKGFGELAVVMAMSVVAIFLALVVPVQRTPSSR